MMIYPSMVFYLFFFFFQVAFFCSNIAYHHRDILFVAKNERAVGGIVLYTHILPLLPIMALHGFDVLFCALGYNLLLILIA